MNSYRNKPKFENNFISCGNILPILSLQMPRSRKILLPIKVHLQQDRNQKNLPSCFDPECNKNHLVKDCDITSAGQAKKNFLTPNALTPKKSLIFSDFTVEVEHLLRDSKKIYHICRICPYADSLIGTPVQTKEVAEYTDQIWYFVNKIKDIRETSNFFKF